MLFLFPARSLQYEKFSQKGRRKTNPEHQANCRKMVSYRSRKSACICFTKTDISYDNHLGYCWCGEHWFCHNWLDQNNISTERMVAVISRLSLVHGFHLFRYHYGQYPIHSYDFKTVHFRLKSSKASYTICT